MRRVVVDDDLEENQSQDAVVSAVFAVSSAPFRAKERMAARGEHLPLLVNFVFRSRFYSSAVIGPHTLSSFLRESSRKLWRAPFRILCSQTRIDVVANASSPVAVSEAPALFPSTFSRRNRVF